MACGSCGHGGGENTAVMTPEQLVAEAQRRADERRALLEQERESALAAQRNAASQ